jgi:ABC-2 type transport system permease protein
MAAARSFVRRAQRVGVIGAAFVYMGAIEAFAYPLGLVTMTIAAALGPITLNFVSQLVPSQPSVGGDYFTFAALGIVATTATSGGLTAFQSPLDVATSTGRLENLLVEPIRWRLLPFGFAGWAILTTLAFLVFQFCLIVVLGADIDWTGLPSAVLIILGGIAAGHAVGVLSASVKILSKRSDPVLQLYVIASGLLSGAAFPIDLLPAPIRVLSYLLPQTYVISAVRRALMPNASTISGPTEQQAILLLIGFLVVVYPLGIWLFGRALEYARRVGTLAGY